MNRFWLFCLYLVPTIGFAQSDSNQSKAVDMADPTAVYSSVGAHLYTNGDLDLSAGFAWGKNMLAVESKQGMDALNVRYAHMNLWQGIGVYAESTLQLENDFGTSASIGAVSTLQVGDSWTIYPIATLGSMEIIEDKWITTGTIGVYNRFKLGSGFSLGVDPFYTLGESGYESIYVDTFISYQYKNHQIRLGYNASESQHNRVNSNTGFTGEGYLEYKMAF
ncbi:MULTISPECIES: hypothetical protein [Vibrio]|uniref:Outer membrane protein beta-barrel domain-containing protein n=1 Tax=Vibrio halioticoli NBRC 102217 TaxID=1219072 RepID=V5FGV5_9VIBR|nr:MULTISPECIES: hypothetical protein [Vibrio]GAD90963.1 hypothetical protein VHA01S_062_00010 [Vibrio halioticoli NBRC 102217]